MKVQSLKNKLNKLKIPFEVKEYNELNHRIVFTINERIVEADYQTNEMVIDTYSSVYDYDEANQSSMRSWYDNFTQVIKRLS